MYLNEKAWEILQEDSGAIDRALRSFLDIYATVKKKYPRIEVYVPDNEELYLRATNYSLNKWMASTDLEYRRLYLTFWQKRICYIPEDDFEFVYAGEGMKGATEAYLNDSFVVSICFDDKWQKEKLQGTLYSVDDKENIVIVKNVYSKIQLESESIKKILQSKDIIKVNSYEELWERREEFFPHLCFCPSVKSDLEILEKQYMRQVIKKLSELEDYTKEHAGERFDVSLLSKTTPETKSTLEKFEKEHTFVDEKGTEYITSWHMRFTGIPGRIFFIPEENYINGSCLVCYIGKKLPNVTYST